MADGFSMTVNTVSFEAAMQRLRAGVKSGLIDPGMGTLSVQGRLLAERCQDFTPPRNVGQGNAAVMRDLTRIYRPVSPNTFDNLRMKQIVRTDNRAAWDAAARNFGGKLRNTSAMAFSEAWHARWRTRRGRTSSPRRDNVGYVTLGPEATAARTYMKKVRARVGWARAGWNIGILGLGGRVKSGWVARHSVNRGQLIDRRDLPDPYIQVVNDTGWAKYNGKEGNRIMRNARDARARDMQNYFTRQMQLAANKAQGIAT